MKGREVTLPEVLDFREAKAKIQMELQEEYPEGIVVSLGMNIPGPVKSGSSVYHAFCEGQERLEQILREGPGTIAVKKGLEEDAGYTAVYEVLGMDERELKKQMILLEERHALGRIFDIDVLGRDGAALSREQVGAGRRKCLICDGDAKVCGRSRAHTVQELQEKVFAIIREWEEPGN